MKHLLIIAFLFFSVSAFAQTGPGGPGGSPDTPIDGGASILIAGGIGYGIKKIRDMKKKQQQDEESNNEK